MEAALTHALNWLMESEKRQYAVFGMLALCCLIVGALEKPI